MRVQIFSDAFAMGLRANKIEETNKDIQWVPYS